MSRIISTFKTNYEAKNNAFPYQMEAFKTIKDMEYSAIFHEQGLGKTKIAIDLLLYWLKEKNIDTVLIVTKKQLVNNWLGEFELHTHIKPRVLSSNKKDNFYVLNSPAKVIITNFETISTDKERIILFLKCRNVAIIIDESTKLKNPDAKITKDFFDISDLFKIRTIMTGTPVANRPYDMWAQIYFLDKGKSLGKNYEEFKNETDLSNDFKVEMPSTESESQGDLDFEKHLVKDIESSCNFNVYIDKLEIKDEYTDEELIAKKTKEEIVLYKNEQIDKLKAYITSLEQEKEDLIENFKDTTSLLLEKIKDFESEPNYTSKKEIIHNNKINNNLNNINNINNIEETKNDIKNEIVINKDNNINNIDDINDNIIINDYYKNMPKNFNKIERPQTAMIAEQLNNPKINSNKMQRCANCQKEILESEFVAHSLICLRHTFRCKKCGELINEKDKKKHLEKYRNPTKILNSIKNNNLQEFTIILEHGLKSDLIIEPILGDHLYHSICRYNRINFIKELMKKKFPLDINALNKNKETPLATAIECKSGECGEYMIKLGCDINLRNKGDLSPLMLAAKKGMKKIFEILVNKGANINDKNILGETPLSLAQANHHEDLAMFILQRSQLKFNKK